MMKKQNIIVLVSFLMASCVNTPDNITSALGKTTNGLVDINPNYATYVVVFDAPISYNKATPPANRYNEYILDVATSMGSRGVLYNFTDPHNNKKINRETSLKLFDCFIRSNTIGQVATLNQGPFIVISKKSPQRLCNKETTLKSEELLIIPLGVVDESKKDILLSVIKEKAVYGDISATKEAVTAFYITLKTAHGDEIASEIVSGRWDVILKFIMKLAGGS